MDKFTVKLLPKAYEDIEHIYNYISEEFKVSDTAKNMVKLIEDAILGLGEFPRRGAERKVGVYANKGYRQLFVKNFTVVYRIDEKLKIVVIITVKYSPSYF
ncbi:MAG: type II toxin-antitoxin system RelE/ParE family toxin [Vallitaleaceae bacterium]|nr:type II toxin-antitoxin system RelE/ParE family toxin [Vallitaleaceae bacterium]